MSIAVYTVVMLLLLALSGGLIVMHRRTWHQAQLEQHEDEHERAFVDNQYRRRVQASGMIGTVGVAIFIGQFTDRYPLLGGFYWFGVILVLFWIILLALGDAAATQAHYHRVRRQDLHQQAQLHAEMRRRQNLDSNGHSSETADD